MYVYKNQWKFKKQSVNLNAIRLKLYIYIYICDFYLTSITIPNFLTHVILIECYGFFRLGHESITNGLRRTERLTVY